MSYQPIYISGMETGLVQNRVESILPNDAYPVLENAFIYRETIKRREGLQLLGRLRRVLTAASLGNFTTIIGTNTLDIFTVLGVNITQPNAEIELGNITSITITFGAPISQTLTDTAGTGVFVVTGAGPITSATIIYSTGIVSITSSAAVGPAAVTITAAYFPGLPVMGIRSKEVTNINDELMVVWDQVYAYIYNNIFIEWIPGTTWTGTDHDFFWTTNYWVTPAPANLKLFWATNFSGILGDPIRYTEGSVWIDFAPTINAAGDKLNQCLAILPFRGRLMVFNTYEGPNLANSVQYRQRIRWAAIGNPISDISALFPVAGDISADAWKDDIRGKGGFLDIPTAEDITAVGFVRDNLVIYCERSTWQLRYTGRSIAPFQIEKVNSELGAESTFSAVQFDTSLVGIGDKGIVECDSFKSERIDIKIPDLVYRFTNENFGPERVAGIRDIQQRLAYWIYPYEPVQVEGINNTYPNRRLVYNYENDSWAIFTDSLTALGTFQQKEIITWNQFAIKEPANRWQAQNYPWLGTPKLFPSIMGGNQQGFVMYLSGNMEKAATNEVSLSITDIGAGGVTAVQSPNHNLEEGTIIGIYGIPAGTPFDNLNDGVFYVNVQTKDVFFLYKYNPISGEFSDPQLDTSGVYVGGGMIAIRTNFNVTSKKFNFADQGQNIQMGFLDVLLNNTSNGAISLNVYQDYNDDSPINILPQNLDLLTNQPDPFFNTIVPTSQNGGIQSSKNWQRVFCAVRGGFLTLQWTFSNAQMNGVEQENDVKIELQILWLRKAGKQLPVGF